MPGGAVAQSAGADSALAEVERGVVAGTNALRRDHGFAPVQPEPRLASVARSFARHLLRHGNLSHAADGRSPAKRVADGGYDYCVVGENLAYQFSPGGFAPAALAARLVAGWAASPEHRRNMLDPDVTETGLGLAQDGAATRVYAVQLFARPRSAQIAWEIANRASKAVIVEADARSVTLRPRTTLRYRQCRATPVVVRSPGERTERTFVPERDTAYVIAEGVPGELRLDAVPRPRR